jgi:hypothetical protein
MLIQTSGLIDTPLDWAVAKCEGHNLYKYSDGEIVVSGGFVFGFVKDWVKYSPSTSWQEGGPIIDRHGINIGTQRNEPGFRPHPDFMWHAQMDTRSYVGYGPTLLIAAMRCFVASRLGDKVDVPDQLLSRCSPTTIAALGLASQAANIRQEASRAGL